jgi:predicted ATPase
MIDRIKIKNFKSIRDLDIALDEINILIGANGAGKSNFISFFKLLRSMKQNMLNTYVAEQGYMDNLTYFGSKEGDFIFGEITFSRTPEKPTNRYAFELLADNQNKAFIKTEYSAYNKSEKAGAEEDWSVFYHPVNKEESIVLSKGASWRDAYVQKYFEQFIVYHFHDTSSRSPLKKSAQVADNRFLRENGENLAAFLYYLQEKHPKSLNRIELVVRSIAPFFEGFSLKPDQINEDLIRLEWKEVGFDRYQNAQNLSDGTLRFIALATLLMQPEPPKTIIIDEPELGLHPTAINKLAGIVKMASAKSQVILSTQSVNLVNYFDPQNIITVDREGQESVFRRLNPEKLESWLSEYGLGDIWFKSVIGGQP